MPVLGLGMIIGVRSTPFREDHMVRKAEMLAAKFGSVEGEGAPEREGLKLAEDVSFKEQVIFTGSTDWTPDQAEHYIDWRIQSVDTDIARDRKSTRLNSSHSQNLVCRLLLEKKKKKNVTTITNS